MVKRLVSEAISTAKRSVLLLGPRQTGKSTLMRGFGPAITVNLAREQEFLAHAGDAGLLERICRAAPKKNAPTLIFVDEVQRLPSLLNSIQAMLDETPRRFKFLLTGSSARKLRRGQANLLPGRIHTYHLGPLAAAELDYGLDLQQALSTGTLPGIWTEDSAEERRKTLSSYAATYLREEIQAESLSRNLEGFARFLGVLALWNGCILDLSKLAQAAQVARTSIVRWFEIAEETLILQRVESYTKNLSQRLVRHPRFYFFDVGVFNGLINNFATSPDRAGILFETFIANQLFSTAAAFDEQISVNSFRTESGVEVDFVVRWRGVLYAIEVKASSHLGRHDIRGLRRFGEIVKEPHRPMLWYSGSQPQDFDGIRALPWQAGLRELFNA